MLKHRLKEGLRASPKAAEPAHEETSAQAASDVPTRLDEKGMEVPFSRVPFSAPAAENTTAADSGIALESK